MTAKNKTSLGKICFFLNLLVMIYFFHLILLYNLKIDTRITGFIRELFTIPFLLGGLVLVVLSVIAFKNDKYSIKTYSFGAILVILLSILMMVLATLFE